MNVAEMTLALHLERAISEPWAWGRSDCSTFVADWIRGQTGADPMAAWRGCYDSEGEAEGLIAEAGGLLELFSRAIDPLWPRADVPREGAAAVISLAGEDGEPIDIGALHTGKRWALRSPRGVAFITAPLAVRAIWAR